MAVDKSTRIDELKRRLAEQSGLDPDRIMVDRLAQYEMLLGQGIGITLHIGGGSMFRVKLPAAVLGLSLSEAEQEFYDDHIDLGDFFTAPREVTRKFRSKEQSARRYLNETVANTIGFEFDTGWIWVPLMESGQGFHAVKARLEEYRADYLAYADAVAGRIEEYKSETLKALDDVSDTIYQRLTGGTDLAPPQFRKELHDFIMANFLTPDDVRRRTYFDIRYKAYPLPSQLAADEAEATKYRLEQEKTEAERQLTQVKLWAERDAEREAAWKRQQMILAEQQRILEEERRRKIESLDPMIAGINDRILALVNEVAQNVQKALAGKGKIPGPTARQVRDLVKNLGPLNMLVGDTRLEDLTARLDALMIPNGTKLNADAIANTLDELHQEVTTRAEALKPDMALYLELD